MFMEITIEKNLSPKPKFQKKEDIVFGKAFSDHMFTMDYSQEKGWHSARITPYAPLTLDPSCMVFHYGQEMFEGLKAYKTNDNRVLLFRPEMNIKRANRTCERLCMPTVPEDVFLNALKTLISLDSQWVPHWEETSLYIRPFMIATDPYLGLKPSTTYKFMIILTPVGPYYSQGLAPIKILIEDEMVRAVRGGVGEAKTGGNYVASMLATNNAISKGYSQVLWLDGVERKYVEEVGAMNVFFKVNDKIITPALSGSLLAGITRDSTITLLKSFGLDVEERKISVDELVSAAKNGDLQECFGTGTAATVSPIGTLGYGDTAFTINNGETGSLTQKVYNTLSGIQTGSIEDKFNWTVCIE